MLTAKRLKTLLHYDPDTGVFTWIAAGKGRNVGDIAGGPHNGYVRVGVDGRRYKAHRLAWLYVHGVWPEDEIDHRNGIGTDNWIKNLRPATSQQNKRNRVADGVYRRNSNRKKVWCARILIGMKAVWIQSFYTREEAVAARKAELPKWHGEFSHTNRASEGEGKKAS